MVNINGAFVLLPAGVGPAARASRASPACSRPSSRRRAAACRVSAKPGIKINTTGIAVDQTVTVGTTQIRDPGRRRRRRFQVAVADIRIVIGDFLTIEGTIVVQRRLVPGHRPAAVRRLRPVPPRTTGRSTPTPTGLLISNAAIDLRKFT